MISQLTSKSSIFFFLALILLVSGVGIAYVSSIPRSNEDVAEDLSRNFQRELRRANDDLDRISLSTDYALFTADWNYPVYIFRKGELIRWSDNKFIPSFQQLPDSTSFKLLNTGSETLLLVRKNLGNDKVAVSAIGLIKKYPINNDYLSTWYNAQILPSENVTILEAHASLGVPVCADAICYFRVSFLPSETAADPYSSIATFLISIGIILFVVWLLNARWSKSVYPEVTFLYTLVILILLRLMMTYLAFPRILVRSQLFDPQYFASSSFNASLGDLLLNLLCLMVVGVYIFRYYAFFSFQRMSKGVVKRSLLSVGCVLATLFAGLFPIVVIQTLYNNSTVDLGIARVMELNTLSIAAFVCVILSGISAFLFTHVFLRTLLKVADWKSLILSVIFASGIFVAINEWSGQQYLSTLVLLIIYIAFNYVTGLPRTLKRLSFNTFAYLFTAILFIAVNGAYAIQYFSQHKKVDNQFRFANNFLIDRDYFGEFLLHELSSKISDDVFIQTRISSPFLGKEPVRQKIRQVLLPSYFNKYDIEIFMFNALGDPIDGHTVAFANFIAAYNRDAYKTDYEGIRFVNNPASDITQKYLIISPIRRASHNAGYIVIELSLKRIIPENVYPELLVDYRFQDYYSTRELSYALIVNRHISFSSGEFNYERLFDKQWLGNTKLYTTGLDVNGYDHIAVEDEGGRIAIVSSKVIPWANRVGNFSLLFVLGLFTVLILIFISGLYQYFRGSRLFFSARIQLYLNLAFFIPLIIVCVSTLGLTSRSSQQQLNEEYLNKSRIFSEQMTNYVGEDSVAQHVGTSELTGRLTQLSKISNLDANIYSRQGKLMGTSQPLIFETNLLSNYINPRAIARVLDGEMLLIESENVGKLQYYVAYSVLKSSQTGRVLGILGIPFFQSGNVLNKVQSIVLINIMNIFACIFIVLLFLSYIVAERLTFPLRFITQSLRRTSLDDNTPLKWGANDEIGMMVKEYNSMLYKLSESKNQLEHTQREKAWREIAQQVAHEIKNPLTPMKLTLQQLERSVQSGAVTNEKTQRAITTLLSQIDTLNEIASSFSGFAKMPEPVIQRIDLVAIIRHAVDLHSSSADIILKNTNREAWVMGDAQLLSRTFSNLILNGIQAARPGHQVKIQVTLDEIDGNYRMSFTDNGRGIAPEIIDRIFLPHFSTKKTGSGLGLSIARQAIEQMNGRIWLTSVVGDGTTFFIQLPATH